MPFSDFKRKLSYFGIELKSGGRGSHFKLSKIIDGVRVIYVVAVHHNKVEDIYVQGTRKRFHLTPEDGISDQDFLRV